jgi:Na+-driven multidrug efflux pump
MAGAAIATGIAQTVAAYMGINYMRKHAPNKLSKPE